MPRVKIPVITEVEVIPVAERVRGHCDGCVAGDNFLVCAELPHCTGIIWIVQSNSKENADG